MEANSKNLHWQSGHVSYEDRCRLLDQPGLVLWFTGLSGSGKSTIAVEVEKKLISQGRLAYRLDGDNIRHGLNSDLGFSEADRNENIRRIAELAALFKDAGLITLTAFISPFRAMRDYARQKISPASFIEIYVKADWETCLKRDPKGLYNLAKDGKVDNFTGLTSPYEEPLNAELTIDTTSATVSEATNKVMDYLQSFLNETKF